MSLIVTNHIFLAKTEEHEESLYNHYISEIRNFRRHVEAHEEHLIRQIRTPLERDDLEQSLQRITEHEVHIGVSKNTTEPLTNHCGYLTYFFPLTLAFQRKTTELNKLKEDLEAMKDKCETFLRQAAGSPSVPTLLSELTVLTQSMSQVHSMSSIYMDK